MQLELIIKGHLIETVDLPIHPDDHLLFSQREAVISDYRAYLKRKYREDLMITDNWSIELVAGSAMNFITADVQNDEDYAEAIAALKATG